MSESDAPKSRLACALFSLPPPLLLANYPRKKAIGQIVYLHFVALIKSWVWAGFCWEALIAIYAGGGWNFSPGKPPTYASSDELPALLGK